MIFCNLNTSNLVPTWFQPGTPTSSWAHQLNFARTSFMDMPLVVSQRPWRYSVDSSKPAMDWLCDDNLLGQGLDNPQWSYRIGNDWMQLMSIVKPRTRLMLIEHTLMNRNPWNNSLPSKYRNDVLSIGDAIAVKPWSSHSFWFHRKNQENFWWSLIHVIQPIQLTN